MTAPLILGAGPAGCAAAIVLARAGAAPVLLDRVAEPGDALCGGFLSWRTATRLAGLGADPATLGAHRVTHLALFAGTTHAAFALPAPAFGLSRRALDSALRERAVAAGAHVAIDTARQVEGLEVVGRQRRWTGDGLFLATGKHDIRGAPRRRETRDPALGIRVRLPATAERRHLLTGRIELHAFAGGYAGIVLQEDGSANLCLAVRKSRLSAAGSDPHALLDQWRMASPAFAQRLGSDFREQRCDSIGAVPYGYLARTSSPGLFKLGDQAAVIPSLAGEGIAIALASGTLAARYWVAGGAGSAPAFQRAFAARATWPIRAASAAWSLAEKPGAARLGVAFASRVPPILRWLMEATRLDLPASLARIGAAP